MLQRATMVLLSVLAAAPAAAQQAPPGDPVIAQVADGLYMLSWRGGNLAVSVGDDGVVLVDDQYAQQAQKNLDAIRALTDRPLRFVLNTHWHGDHTGANEAMAEQGALVIAHHNVRRRMSADQVIPFFDTTIPASPPGALPVVTFDSDVMLHFNGESVHAFHVPPAHTDGDAVVHFRNADVIHAGDLFFNGSFPYVDTASGGRLAGVIAAATRILEMCGAETKVIPGHGPLADCDDLRAYRDMLTVVHDRIVRLLADGADADAVVAARPAAEYAERWASGFMPEERWVRSLVDNLEENR